MLKSLLIHIVAPGIALFIAMPATLFAEPFLQKNSRIQRHSVHQSKQNWRSPRQHRRPARYRRHDSSHHRHHRRHHRHHRRHHRHHRVYPHGHAYHIHDAYCPVIVHPVVTVPAWEVYYHRHDHHSSAAILHIVIGPFSGALYIDDHYYGDARHLHGGKLKLSVSPGLHTVKLHHRGRTYTHQVRVKPGATAVVKAKQL